MAKILNVEVLDNGECGLAARLTYDDGRVVTIAEQPDLPPQRPRPILTVFPVRDGKMVEETPGAPSEEGNARSDLA